MSERLQAWLREERVLPEGELEAAVARQTLYGGGLDTAILERGTMTEPAVWARLAAATGLPAPTPALCDPARLTLPPALDAAFTDRLHAVPVTVTDGTIDLLCCEPFVESDIRAAVQAMGFLARLYVVPETRLLAMRQRAYGEPLPARYVPLLARAVGTAQARKGYAPPRVAVTAAGLPESPYVETDVTPGRQLPPPLSQDATAAAAAPVVAADTTSPTPLEQVLELSGPLTAASDEVDGEAESGAQPMESLPDPASGPLRLQLMSEGALSKPLPLSSTASGSAEAVPTRVEAASPSGHEHLEPSADPATEALCRRARDPADKGRALALRALRRRLTHPATLTLLGDLRAVVQTAGGDKEAAIIDAIQTLVEVREGSVVRLLIERLDAGAGSQGIADAARRGLVALAAQDFGPAARPWRAWAESHAHRHRVEWLLDGLGHKKPEIRMAAAEELRQLAGDSFGYAWSGPKREREAARRRFVAWWQTISRPERLIPDEAAFFGAGGAGPLPPEPKAR